MLQASLASMLLKMKLLCIGFDIIKNETSSFMLFKDCLLLFRKDCVWRAVSEINCNFFVHKIFLWCSIILFLSTWNIFLCYINFFFCWHEILFREHQHVSVETKITFSAMSNFLFQHKITFRATSNFCFWHHLCYVLVIYFYCHIATKI